MSRFTATKKASGQRLDIFVLTKLPALSRSFVQRLSEKGEISVNSRAEKPGYKIKVGDRITVKFDKSKLGPASKIELPTIYEDQDCLVIDKPAGILTHSKGSFNPEASVATFIRPKVKDLNGERAGIVHRLDRATSGVMICAKNKPAQTWLQKQFSNRRAKKSYTAIVAGQIKPEQAVIDMPIRRNPKKPQVFQAHAAGKPATTSYKLIKSSPGYSLVELTPTTGRTHQLRVHLAKIGFPIVGDNLYGGGPADRLYLHSGSLEIVLPTRQRHIFTAPLPKEFDKLLQASDD